MWFALLCHLASVAMTLMANGYNALYWAAFVGALGNGTIEAVINPVIASVYHKEKTKWLNILHAGWPMGLMLAGAITLGIEHWHWQWKISLILLPVLIYGVMLITCSFPISERVAAGITDRDMLKELGGVGIFIPTVLILEELGRVLLPHWAFSFNNITFTALLLISITLSVTYGLMVKSIGNPMYVLMLIVMLPLATTELGTDGWIKDLMGPAMKQLGFQAGWLLVYTSSIMVSLRFLAGPIMRLTRLNPLGLLTLSCILVISGITWLSRMNTHASAMILVAAFIYGAGQCFFWPTTLGFVAERFPKGGALTLNTIAGVGMLGVGILGGPWLGYVQNSTISEELQAREPALYEQIVGNEKQSMFGSYFPIDNDKLSELIKAQPADANIIQTQVQIVQTQGKSAALLKVTVLPWFMLVTFLGLILYFKTKGGYKPVELEGLVDSQENNTS